MRLPEELFVAVTRHLDPKDVKELSLVNKQLRKQCRARLFAKIAIDIPAVKDGLSMQDCIRTNYRHFSFVRVLELHIGYQHLERKRGQKESPKRESYDERDLCNIIEDFSAFFALLQISLTDIHYNFYARDDDEYRASERTLFSRIIEAVLQGYRTEQIRGHVHAGSLLRQNRCLHERLLGLLVAIPSFQSAHHLRAIIADNEYVRLGAAGDILTTLPNVCRPAQCSFRGWCIPEDSFERLPSSLHALSLSISSWEDFGNQSWDKIFKAIQGACPKLVNLAVDISPAGLAVREELEEEIAAESVVLSNFPHLESLQLVCNSIHAFFPQLALKNALKMLNAPLLTNITIEGGPAWYWLSILNIEAFFPKTKLTKVNLIETLEQTGMVDDDFPWHSAPDIPSITRPLFQHLMQRMEALGIAVGVSAISNEARAIPHRLTPDEEEFQVSLSTIQDYVQHIEAQMFPPSAHEALKFDTVYSFPRLRTLKVYCAANTAISSMARTWVAPNLEDIDIQIVGNGRDVALRLGDLTDTIKFRGFPSLLKITGEINGMLSCEGECVLEEMFKKAFRQACKARHVNIDGLAWK